MLAKNANDNACRLDWRGVLMSLASKLAPTKNFIFPENSVWHPAAGLAVPGDDLRQDKRHPADA